MVFSVRGRAGRRVGFCQLGGHSAGSCGHSQVGAIRGSGNEAMTSRQPGRTAPDTGTPGAGPGQAWALVVPLTLLILLGLAGLRGVVSAPHWNGPLRHDGVVIGLVLEVILGVLLVITVRRVPAAIPAQTHGAPLNDVAAKLRGVLILVLGAGMVAVAAAILIGLHLHVFSKPARHHPGRAQAAPGEAEVQPGTEPGELPHPAVCHPVRPAHPGARGRGGAQHPVVPSGSGGRSRSGTAASSPRTPRTCGRR